MSLSTTIEWTDVTFNPWIGCNKVSAGCKFCYAEVSTPVRVARSKGIELWGTSFRRRTSSRVWAQVPRWNNAAAKSGVPLRVFGDSVCDWLDTAADIEIFLDYLYLISENRSLVWQLLTKRPENWRPRMEMALDYFLRNFDDPNEIERNLSFQKWLEEWLSGIPPRNVWIGASAEDPAALEKRCPLLNSIPARLRFLSCEPLLDALTLPCQSELSLQSASRPVKMDGIGWIIVGGESGSHARPCDTRWIESIVAQCRYSKTPVFVKQLGKQPTHNGHPVSLKHPKGGDINEWPESLRVRECPALN